MGEGVTKTVAKAYGCGLGSDCLAKVEAYIMEEPPKIFDSYTCTATPLMNGNGTTGCYLTGILVLCTGTPKKGAAAK